MASLCIGGAAFSGYSHFVESEWLEIGRHTLETKPSGKQPVTLLHLADLHASSVVSLDYISEAIDLGLRQKPDFICITGDFITRKYPHLDAYSRVLSRLPQAAPTFATLGNHDGGAWASRHRGYKTVEEASALVRQSRIDLLENVNRTLFIRGREIQLAGLADLWAGNFNPARAFNSFGPTQAVRIVLSHNPDTKSLIEKYHWDLMLSGHTHGGQFYLPLIGAPFAPIDDPRFLAGMYEWNGRHLHITKGVGNVWGMRFNCRPEVSVITIA